MERSGQCKVKAISAWFFGYGGFSVAGLDLYVDSALCVTEAD